MGGKFVCDTCSTEYKMKGGLTSLYVTLALQNIKRKEDQQVCM